MFQHYLNTALRSLFRHKLYSFLNIAGLAIGLACAIFVILFIRDEVSYDAWIPGTENLFRVGYTVMPPGQAPASFATVPYPMAIALQEAIPGITRVTWLEQESVTFTVGDRQFTQEVNVVAPDFFDMVKLPLVAGPPATVLREPDSVVISQSYAQKYFGDTDPIGRVITTSHGACGKNDPACKPQIVSLKVSGVVRDIPYNSQLRGDVFISTDSLANRESQSQKQSWLSHHVYSYIELSPGTDLGRVISQSAALFDKLATGQLHQLGVAASGSQVFKLRLTPFERVHLDSGQFEDNLTAPGSWVTVYGVGAIGVIVLLTAAFNFMNLATARAILRRREIALRKTLGARRAQIVLQFLGEAVLTALMALLIALSVTEVLLPVFYGFLRRPITFLFSTDWQLLLLALAAAVMAGLIGGIYPALVLSGVRPAMALRTNNEGRAGAGGLRSLLVILQFSASIGLGIAALVVFSQVSYARVMQLGFSRDNILVIGGGHVNSRASIVQTLRSNPGIIDIGMASKMPFTDSDEWYVAVGVPGRPDNIPVRGIVINPEFPDVLGMRLLAGRLLSDARASDQTDLRSAIANDFTTPTPQNEGHDILINETGAQRLGFKPQEAVGRSILMLGNHFYIVGVLADANFHGAKQAIDPAIYIYDPNIPLDLALKLRPDLIPETLGFIDRSWHAFSPTTTIHRYFLDDGFNELYQDDKRQGAMFAAFVATAIAIACMGLFGLAAFTAGHRTKEIGIRKVFGARTDEVIFLLLRQFSVPVLVANVIAWPIAWYYLRNWLQGFAYHITLSPLYFVGVGAAALVLAWVTIFVHVSRVAGANPIYALRNE